MQGKTGLLKNLLRFDRYNFLPVVLFLVCTWSMCPAQAAFSANRATDTKNKAGSSPYGIDTTGLDVQLGKVRPGDTLGTLLQRHGVPASRVTEAVREVRNVFNPRKMQSGNPFVCYREGEDGPARFFVYELTPLDYLVLDLGEDVSAYRDKKPETRKTMIHEGTIAGSLWQSLSSHNYGKELSLKIHGIFAWVVDFYRLQKGDRYAVLFDEGLVEGRPVTLSGVRAARITHGEKDFYAFQFEQEDIRGYYDEQGNNLRRRFLKSPVQYGRITSHFSRNRLHPVLKTYRAHLGTDFAAPRGTPIMSVAQGVVAGLGYDSSRGKYVRIRHGSPYETEYLHMSRFAPGIRKGASVEEGQTIGYVGSTGLATGPHVDLRLFKNGRLVNFLKEEFPAGKPLPDRFLGPFLEQVARLKPVLDGKAGLLALGSEVQNAGKK